MVEIVARDVQPLRGLKEQMAREVRLSASLSEIFDDVFVTLKDRIAEAPGTVPVVIELRRPGQFHVALKAAGRYAVRPSPELTRQLVELLGPGGVRLIPSVS
ncbi:MAG: hypothetical protein IT186_01980 [Acidobacteria bacterium]|nr:hypothetical protein [Acidobacteriota bacterium]